MLPPLDAPPQPALRALGRGPPKAMFPIIDDVSGIIKPGAPGHKVLSVLRMRARSMCMCALRLIVHVWPAEESCAVPRSSQSVLCDVALPRRRVHHPAGPAGQVSRLANWSQLSIMLAFPFAAIACVIDPQLKPSCIPPSMQRQEHLPADPLRPQPQAAQPQGAVVVDWPASCSTRSSSHPGA